MGKRSGQGVPPNRSLQGARGLAILDGGVPAFDVIRCVGLGRFLRRSAASPPGAGGAGSTCSTPISQWRRFMLAALILIIALGVSTMATTRRRLCAARARTYRSNSNARAPKRRTTASGIFSPASRRSSLYGIGPTPSRGSRASSASSRRR